MVLYAEPITHRVRRQDDQRHHTELDLDEGGQQRHHGQPSVPGIRHDQRARIPSLVSRAPAKATTPATTGIGSASSHDDPTRRSAATPIPSTIDMICVSVPLERLWASGASPPSGVSATRVTSIASSCVVRPSPPVRADRQLEFEPVGIAPRRTSCEILMPWIAQTSRVEPVSQVASSRTRHVGSMRNGWSWWSSQLVPQAVACVGSLASRALGVAAQQFDQDGRTAHDIARLGGHKQSDGLAMQW